MPDDCGVGLRITETAPYYVRECLVGSPAYQSKLIRPDDMLLAVDGLSVGNLTIQEVRAMISGPAGSAVHLRFRRLRSGASFDEFLTTDAVRSDSTADERQFVYEVKLTRRRNSVQAAATTAISPGDKAARRASGPSNTTASAVRQMSRRSWAASGQVLCKDLSAAAAVAAAAAAADSEASR